MDDIHSLSEEDIKLRYITPAILAKGWSVQDMRPDELLKQYHEKRSALDAKIDQTLSEIQKMLGITID